MRRFMLDADLVLEALLDRGRYKLKDANDFWKILKLRRVQGYVTETGLNGINFCMDKLKGPEIAKEVVSEIKSVVEVCPVNRSILNFARSPNFRDIRPEAAVELVCAIVMNVDAIVAWNPQDFLQHTFCTYSLGEFLLEQLSADQIMGYIIDLERLLLPSVAAESVAVEMPVNLRYWFQNVCEAGWQTIGDIWKLDQTSPFTFRSASCLGKIAPDQPERSVSRAKVIDLGTELASQAVMLVVRLTLTSNGEVDIRLQVLPANGLICLPRGLQLVVLDESGATVIEAQARSMDNQLQIEFDGCPKELFAVKVTLGDASITENFVI